MNASNVLELTVIAKKLDSNWSEEESIDWEEAENLVRCMNQMPEEIKQTAAISQILDYANENSDWDSGEVANWPQSIIDSLQTK